MISFRDFVNAIHDAIVSANKSLIEENLELLNEFFVRSTRENDPDDPDDDEEVLKAKSVVVEYPGPKGEPVEVNVPLITLAPITTNKIDKVKVTADFQMRVIDNKLQLDFPRKGGEAVKDPLFGKKRMCTSFGRLEITLKPQEIPDGLDNLIEGYEKALKSQIPN